MMTPLIKGNNNNIEINFIEINKIILDGFKEEENYIEGNNNIVNINFSNVASYITGVSYNDSKNAIIVNYRSGAIDELPYLNYINAIAAGDNIVSFSKNNINLQNLEVYNRLWYETNDGNRTFVNMPSNFRNLPQYIDEYFCLNSKEELDDRYIVLTYEDESIAVYQIYSDILTDIWDSILYREDIDKNNIPDNLKIEMQKRRSI